MHTAKAILELPRAFIDKQLYLFSVYSYSCCTKDLQIIRLETHAHLHTRHQRIFIHQLRLSRIVLLHVAANFSTSNRNSLLYLVTFYQLDILKSVDISQLMTTITNNDLWITRK
jgi:hypothetical protein